MDAFLSFLSSLYALIAAHAWLAVAALVIGGAVRLLKSDTKLPIAIPAQWRALAAVGLGVGGGVVQALAAGTPLASALMQGLGAAVAAIAGHEVVIEGIRGGKEIPMGMLARKASAAALVFLFATASIPMSGCKTLTPQQVNEVTTPVSQIGCKVVPVLVNPGPNSAVVAAVCESVAPTVVAVINDLIGKGAMGALSLSGEEHFVAVTFKGQGAGVVRAEMAAAVQAKLDALSAAK